MRMDLTKLRAIQKELSVLSKVRSSGKKSPGPKRNSRNKNSTKKRKKKTKPSNAQLRARKEFVKRVRAGEFR